MKLTKTIFVLLLTMLILCRSGDAWTAGNGSEWHGGVGLETYVYFSNPEAWFNYATATARRICNFTNIPYKGPKPTKQASEPIIPEDRANFKAARAGTLGSRTRILPMRMQVVACYVKFTVPYLQNAN